MMQQSPYSAYDSQFQSDLQLINKRCGLEIPTEILPHLIPVKVEVDPFCLSDIYHVTEEGDTCNSIAKNYGVASAAVQSGNSRKISDCGMIQAGQELCMPLTCSIYELQQDDLCVAIEAEYGIRNGLRTYNPWIDPDCSNLESGRMYFGGIVCISPQGGSSTNISSVSNGDIFPSWSNGYTEDATYPPAGAKLAAGTITNCGKWHIVQEKETCASICIQEQINIDLFIAVNPSLEVEDCSSKLVTNTTLCVGPRATWEDEPRVTKRHEAI